MQLDIRPDELTIAPLRKNEGQLKIDFAKAAKGIAALVGLSFGWKGLPAAIAAFPDTFKILYRDVEQDRKAQAQGFALYVTGLVYAISALCKEYAPKLFATEDQRKDLTPIILGALNREELRLDQRFFRSPALNPGFVRVRERLLTLLEHPAVQLPDDVTDQIGTKLGSQFAVALGQLVQTLKGKDEFKEFLEFFSENPFASAINRSWLWDDYRSTINRRVYQRLFLYEMEGHPDVGLADLYVASRATYRTKPLTRDDKAVVEPTRVHAFDLANHLNTAWLGKAPNKVGLARLLTGDPGSGKSTFSLMYAQALLRLGWRVLVIPANSIRSLELSLKDILATHLMHTLKLDAAPNVDNELSDPENTGKPLLVILDGLDEYDVAGMTVSMAAAQLAEHALQVVDEWSSHGYNVRLLLCGRPEAAAGLSARFRDEGRHLHVTGFLAEPFGPGETAADVASSTLLAQDQREEWWRNWQAALGEKPKGLPEPIRASQDSGVREITSQPLLNYMLAVLRLYEEGSLTNLSALYGELFSRYYERQAIGKSSTFESLCPDLDRFRRIMSEIGLAAWHAGDRSVSVDDLRVRFDRPPLKSWFEQAGRSHNSGLGAILSAFYTRPEDAASPHSGLAERYVFTHKSFREYLTAVGIVRFLERLSEYLDPNSEDGWSDAQALSEWLALFGPTATDQRQWEFVHAELQLSFGDNLELASKVKRTLERMFEFALMRKMPLPTEPLNQEYCLLRCGNAEEAMLLMLSAVRAALDIPGLSVGSLDSRIDINWMKVSPPGLDDEGATELREFLSRIRARPGYVDSVAMFHMYCLFERGGEGLNRQAQTQFRKRPDGWDYASVIDFSGANLTNADFSGCRLLHSRFHRTELSGAKFVNSALSGSDFGFASNGNSQIVLSSGLIDFSRSELAYVSFSRARLRPAKFDRADIDNLNIVGAHIDEESLISAGFSEILVLDAIHRDQPRRARRNRAK